MNKKIRITKCQICGSNSFELYLVTKDYFFTQEEFELSKCTECGFVFTNPIPENLGKYYETDQYLSHNTNSNGLLGNLYSYLRSVNIKKKYKLVTKYNTKESILDIGCGTGELLAYFKKNKWKTTGIEPNETARNFADNVVGIEVYNEDKLNSLDANSFDVITMWHVLEHVPDLNNRLKQINRLAKKDATIFIALPNLQSPDALKYKEYWSALDVPRHLYHFTQSTFKKLIAKHNLKLVHAEPMKFDSYYVSMLSEKYKKNSLYLISAFFNGAISNFKAKNSNNYSSMIYVVKQNS